MSRADGERGAGDGDRADAPDLREILALVERIFGRDVDRTVGRVAEGVSTYVYRVRRRANTHYLRVLPEVGARFTPEALAHRLLCDRGVRVPDVVYVDDCDARLGLAVMATTEIPGVHVGQRPVSDRTRQVMIEAGRQLALVNTVTVDGFGWIKRDAATADRLLGEHPTFTAAVHEHLDADLTLLEDRVFEGDEVAAIRAVMEERAAWLDAARATLAHGDFDATQIFQRRGRYTGIIDFGEIRGGDAWYDLGHFRMRDGETLPRPVLNWLLEGYREATPLPPEHLERIAFSCLLIAVRALARRLARTSSGVGHHIGVAAVRREVEFLRT